MFMQHGSGSTLPLPRRNSRIIPPKPLHYFSNLPLWLSFHFKLPPGEFLFPHTFLHLSAPPRCHPAACGAACCAAASRKCRKFPFKRRPPLHEILGQDLDSFSWVFYSKNSSTRLTNYFNETEAYLENGKFSAQNSICRINTQEEISKGKLILVLRKIKK